MGSVFRRVPGHVMLSSGLLVSIGVLLYILLPLKMKVEYDPLAIPGPDAPVTPALALLPHEKPHDLLSLVKAIVDLNAGMSVEEMNAVGGMSLHWSVGEIWHINSDYMEHIDPASYYFTRHVTDNVTYISYTVILYADYEKCQIKAEQFIELLNIKPKHDKVFMELNERHDVVKRGNNIVYKFIGNSYKMEVAYNRNSMCVSSISIDGVGRK